MNEKTYLICDCVGSASLEILTEGTQTKGDVIIRGKFQEADSPNKNKRIYPRVILDPQVSSLQEMIKNGGLPGELDHPTDSVIHFENVSHIITMLEWRGKELYGALRVLKTPSGQILRTLIDEGVKIGISSRGVGSGRMNNEGITVINDGFKLITFDIVADPSTNGAYLQEDTQPQEQIPTAECHKSEESHTNSTHSNVDSNTNESKQLDPFLVEGFLKALFRSKR